LDAESSGKITASAAGHIRDWLTQPRFADYQADVRSHIEQERWERLDDVFWTIIPFGTGGRRGRMYPIGCNAINDRTIGESAAGLSQYVRQQPIDPRELSCAIAYDTRHNSRHFAELCARIMVAAGFKVYFLDDYRSTPALSFLVRYRNCSCGIMVTASHNPPSDNAVKVYWAGGVQVLPPHDRAIIECVTNVSDIELGDSFEVAVHDGRVVICTEEIDRAYLDAVLSQANPGPRDLKIVYSPLHGVGDSAAGAALRADGFTEVETFGPHAEPNGDFPNVPGHVSNPENPQIYAAIVEHARQVRADLVIVTDPDCDRIGCAAPRTGDVSGPWTTFTGNQLAALLADYVLEKRKAAGTLNEGSYLVKTLVTTEMVRRIGDSYSVTTCGDLLVGFKWIGGLKDEVGPDNFVFGCEESHGYLAGTHVRDKDGGVAAMLIAELAAELKSQGKTLYEKLESLWWQHGYHAELLVTQVMEGSEGMERMKALMAAFRQAPPTALGGIEVAAVRDYLTLETRRTGDQPHPLSGPRGDLIMIDLAEPGNYVAVRPSGTEPKAKFYMFAYTPPEQLADLETAQENMRQRIEAMEADLAAFATRV
jgi:phosphoglucomutase/phosphomannomutase